MRELEHITITSGGARISSRGEVSDCVVHDLRAAIARDDGVVKGTPWRVTLLPSPDGGHVYDLRHGTAHLARCWLCLDPGAEAGMWAAASASGIDAGARLHRPSMIPWLAVALTHQALLAPHDAMMELGDLERCVAWALME